MGRAAIWASLILIPVGWVALSNSSWTFSPVRVVVAPMSIDDDLVAGQRPPTSVHSDVAEESVLDLVPLAAAGGGRWHTVMTRSVCAARVASSVFHARSR